MNKKSKLRVIVVLAVIFLVLWCISNFTSLFGVFGKALSVLTPILAGFSIAFILNIPLRLFERLWIKLFGAKRRGLRRAVCILLCFLSLAGIVALLAWFIIPQVYSNIEKFLTPDNLSKYLKLAKSIYGKAAHWLKGFSIDLPAFNLTADKIITFVSDYFSKNSSDIIGQSVNMVSSAFSIIFDTVFAVAISVYVLAQKESLGRQARKLLYSIFSEKNAERVLTVARLTNKTFSKFITGQITEAVILAILCYIGMLIFNMPFRPIVSTIIGITALIPIFGAFFGAGVGAVLIFIDSPIKALWFIIFIIILQQLEGNIIYPKVVGTHVGLPGLWVLVAVTIGSEFGIVGMLIAVPLSSLIYTIGRQIINATLKKKGLDGMFEEIPEPKKKRKWPFSKKKKDKGTETDTDTQTDAPTPSESSDTNEGTD